MIPPKQTAAHDVEKRPASIRVARGPCRRAGEPGKMNTRRRDGQCGKVKRNQSFDAVETASRRKVERVSTGKTHPASIIDCEMCFRIVNEIPPKSEHGLFQPNSNNAKKTDDVAGLTLARAAFSPGFSSFHRIVTIKCHCAQRLLSSQFGASSSTKSFPARGLMDSCGRQPSAQKCTGPCRNQLAEQDDQSPFQFTGCDGLGRKRGSTSRTVLIASQQASHPTYPKVSSSNCALSQLFSRKTIALPLNSRFRAR